MKDILIKKNNIFFAIIKSFLLLVIELMTFIFLGQFTKNYACIYLFAYIITTTIYVMYNKDFFNDIKTFKQIIKKDYLNIIFYLITFTLLVFISNYAIELICSEVASNEQDIESIIVTSPIIGLLAFGIFGPITEECMFRHTFKNSSKNKMLALIVSSTLFAIMHLTNTTNMLTYLYLIPYFILGLFFGYGIYRNNNIFVSILYHVTYNLINIMILFII